MFKRRSVQTKVKHIILDHYLKSWGGIIINGSRGTAHQVKAKGKPFELHFVYVDCFAGRGRYIGEQEDVEANRPTQVVYGSPIIGVQALDSIVNYAREQGVPSRVNSILVESAGKSFEELRNSLGVAGLGDRVQETEQFHRLRDGEIAVLCADSTALVAQLLNYTTNGHTFAFYLLDPYGPRGIPFHFVSQVIHQQRHDVLINMPYQDLHKKSGIIRRGHLTSEEQSLLRNYDLMFGDTRWRHIVEEWASSTVGSQSSEALEIRLADYYGDSLRSVDQNLTVKSLPLRFPDRERTMFHLYLTTHDPTGALRMNRIMWEAGYQEHNLRWQLKQSKKEKGGQLPLFASLEVPPLKTAQRDSVEDIAWQIFHAFSGRTVDRRMIYQYLADERYFAEEINQALSRLKKEDKAHFVPPANKLTNSTPITFTG